MILTVVGNVDPVRIEDMACRILPKERGDFLADDALFLGDALLREIGNRDKG